MPLNRSTVGDDPDLIHPGMTLIAPEGPLMTLSLTPARSAPADAAARPP